MKWPPVRRIAFRFGFLAAALLLLPFPLDVIPQLGGLAELVTAPLHRLVDWFATGVLGLGELPAEGNNSSDTASAYVQHLVIAILAALGAALWSALDRRRTAHPRLAAGAIVVLRYYLAFTLLTYAFAKLTQFPVPPPGRLDQRVGDLSPMGILWTFMGSSRGYTMFAGFVEGLGGVLLLWRRTHLVGALVAMAAMSNVVAINLCYDVPVKLLSMQLLLISAAILAPHARRLIGALLGRATAEIPPRPRLAPRRERARLALKALVLAAIAIHLHAMVDRSRQWPPRHELHGIWVVDRFVQDGVERPPLLTDGERWHKLYLSQLGAGVRPMTGPLVRLAATFDPAVRAIAITGEAIEERWRYTLAESGALVIDGVFRGKPVHAELHREPEPLLVTRGFHWISEGPFNR